MRLRARLLRSSARHLPDLVSDRPSRRRQLEGWDKMRSLLDFTADSVVSLLVCYHNLPWSRLLIYLPIYLPPFICISLSANRSVSAILNAAVIWTMIHV